MPIVSIFNGFTTFVLLQWSSSLQRFNTIFSLATFGAFNYVLTKQKTWYVWNFHTLSGLQCFLVLLRQINRNPPHAPSYLSIF